MKTERVLDIKNLSVEYQTLTDKVVAVKDISLWVDKKEALGLLENPAAAKAPSLMP